MASLQNSLLVWVCLLVLCDFHTPGHAQTTQELFTVNRPVTALRIGEQYVDRDWHKWYVPSRHKFHYELVDNFLKDKTPAESPRLIFMAGSFGSGKSTTLAKLRDLDFFNLSEFVVVDMDFFRELVPEYLQRVRLGDNEPGTHVHQEVGYIFEIALWESFRRGLNVVVEGSLGNTDFFRRAINAVRHDFPHYQSIGLVHVDSGLESVNRAFKRGAETGRRLQKQTVLDSITQVEQSVEILRPFFDWSIKVDNSKDHPLIVSVDEDPSDNKRISTNIVLKDTPWLNGFGWALDRLAGFKAKKNVYSLVFDIDWTLYYHVDKKIDENTIYYGGVFHQPVAYIDEFFAAVQKLLPHLNVSFSSGGSKDRVNYVLKRTKLSSGQSLYALSHMIQGFDSLVPVLGAPDNAPFTARFKKSLAERSSGVDYSRTILFDDQPGFALPPLLAAYSLGDFRYAENFCEDSAADDFESSSSRVHDVQRDRLVVFAGAIYLSYLSDQNLPGTFAQTLSDMMGSLKPDDPSAYLENPMFETLEKYGRLLMFGSEEDLSTSGMGCQSNFRF